MVFTNRKLMVLGLCVALQACTQIDDYMLGKDNTLKPSPLPTITQKVNLVDHWSLPVSKSSKTSTYLKLKPVIRGSIIYTANANGMVQAIDRVNGHVLWSKQLKEGVVSGPTVSEGVVAVGTNRSKVVLLGVADGSELKSLKVSGDVLSKPVIKNHKIIVKTIDGNLYAFDLKTGSKLWASEHGTPHLILKASSSPVVRGSMVLVGFSDGKLDAVDVQTGRVDWQRSIAYASGFSDVERLVDIDADPIVRGDIVYLASYQGYVGAMLLSTGEFLWRKPASVYKNLALDANTLYLTDNNDVLWAFNKQNGQVKWKQESLKARGLTEPVLMGHYLIVGDKTGFLHVVATRNGELASRAQLSGPIDIAPAVASNNIYVMTANGKLNRFSVS